jgi:hypothetical protein
VGFPVWVVSATRTGPWISSPESSLGPIRESLLGASGAVGGGCTCVRRFWGNGVERGW